jgi:hypothetical protein
LLADNTKSTAKKKVRGKPFTKDDPRINRNGAPRVGLSWREILDEIGNLDGAQALERAGRIFAQLKKYPDGVTLKELAAISYFIRMINDPNGSLLTAVADRTDGKVTDNVDLTSGGKRLILNIVKADANTDADTDQQPDN